MAHVCDLAAREQGASRAVFLFDRGDLAMLGLVRHLGGNPDAVAGVAEVPIGPDRPVPGAEAGIGPAALSRG